MVSRLIEGIVSSTPNGYHLFVRLKNGDLITILLFNPDLRVQGEHLKWADWKEGDKIIVNLDDLNDGGRIFVGLDLKSLKTGTSYKKEDQEKREEK